MSIVNRIGEPEQERLGLYSEEMGEAQQVVGKILRHGLDSTNPEESSDSRSNQKLLEKETGDILAAIDILVACGTLDRAGLERARMAKLQKLQRWLHCGTNLHAAEELLREAVHKVNSLEATNHAIGGCDAPNIGVTSDGIMFCCHCGWNDPKGAQARCGNCESIPCECDPS